ncbi:MAG: protein kinase [Myxococcota bacterium]|nr:protein kinase [Myxococcota bacterium]
MLCNRCGSPVSKGAEQCGNCGYTLTTTRRVMKTMTSFRSLELRRLRAADLAEKPYEEGERIQDRYVVRDLIGHGALGTVYKAYEEETGLDVALKVIHEHLVDTEAAEETFFEALRKLGRHESNQVLRLVPVRDGKRLMTRSLFTVGLSLRKVIDLRSGRGEVFGLTEIAPRIFQLMRALEDLHALAPHGLVKPENVILQSTGVSIADAGLLQALPRHSVIQAQKDANAHAYLAPEVLNGNAATIASDVYSVGAIIYEILTGSQYAAGGPSISSSAPNGGAAGGKEVDNLIAYAMSETPAQRFDTMADFADALAATVDSIAKKEAASAELEEETVRLARAQVGARSTRQLNRDADGSPLQGRQIGSADVYEAPVLDAASADDDVAELLDEDLVVIDDDELGSVVDTESDQPALMADVFYDELEPTSVEDESRDDERTEHEGLLVGASATGRSEGTAAVQVLAGPWYTRTKLGFVVAVGLIFAAVGVMVMFYLYGQQRQMNELTPKVAAVADKSPPPAPSGQPPLAVPEPESVPKKAGPATPVADGKVAIANPVDATVATPQPATTAKTDSAKRPTPDRVEAPVARQASRTAATDLPPPSPSSAPTPAAKTTLAALPAQPKAVEKIEAAKPPSKAEPKATSNAKVETPPKAKPQKPTPPAKTPERVAKQKPASVAKVKPKSVEKRTPKKNVVPPRAPQVDDGQTKAGDDWVSCPKTMRMIRTGRFPKGSYKRGKLKGKRALDMAYAGKAYCIDIYEYPGRGQMPKTRVTFQAAEGLCKRSGKRLCSDSEWARACRGSRGSQFPYGRNFVGGRCNTEDAEGEESVLKPTGAFRKCKSRWFVYDMSGNAAEWTANQTVRGGDYTASDEDAACNGGGRRSPSSSRPNIGFRCCKSFKR